MSLDFLAKERGKLMPKYLLSVSYTLEGARGLRTEGGTKREHVVRLSVEGLGGKLASFYYALGEHDVITIVDVPDAVTVAALSLAVAASGAARCSTTPLLSGSTSNLQVSVASMPVNASSTDVTVRVPSAVPPLR